MTLESLNWQYTEAADIDLLAALDAILARPRNAETIRKIAKAYKNESSSQEPTAQESQGSAISKAPIAEHSPILVTH